MFTQEKPLKRQVINICVELLADYICDNYAMKNDLSDESNEKEK